jgi:hypothetical protein
MRPVALSRKNSLFAGSDEGGENWACMASLIETCKLNAVNPQTYLTDLLTRLVNGWPQDRIDELMPWCWKTEADTWTRQGYGASLTSFRNLAAQERIRALISRCSEPTARRRGETRARFDRIFARRTGFTTLERLRANKSELLMVLDRPDIPLHTNGSERDIRCYVIKRKISGGTRSDAFLGLMHTCAKLSIAFWDYLDDRLGSAAQVSVPASLISFAAAAGQPDAAGPRFCPDYHPRTGLITAMSTCSRRRMVVAGLPLT